MKKLNLVFVLLLGLLFSQVTVAATLSWVSQTINSPNSAYNATNVDPQNLTGSVDFNAITSIAYTDTWRYLLNGDELVDNFAIEYFDNQLKVSSVFVDGFSLTDTVFGTGKTALRQWIWSGPLTSGQHEIKINIAQVVKASAQYDLKVSTVPVPAAIWLFGSALVGLVGLSRRKASANGLTA